MLTPAHTLRAVFALSALACSVILVLFVRGRVTWTTEFWVVLGVASTLLAAALCAFAFRQGRMRLVGVPLTRLARVFLPQLVYAYVASALAITTIAWALIYAVTRTGANALALAVLAGLWLSLWLAPGIAAVTSGLKLHSA